MNMTLFQLVTIDSPVKLTDKGNKTLHFIREKLSKSPQFLQDFIEDGLEGLEIGLSFNKKGEGEFFERMVDRDLW